VYDKFALPTCTLHCCYGFFLNNFDPNVTDFVFFNMEHLIIKHAPWFVENYGSLSVWSCQRLEFSRHSAKAAYFRHTAMA
jgi:hypothetical protein